jgi:hypothetical protein
MRSPELYKSMKIFTRKSTAVILELSNPNPRAGFQSVLPACGLYSTFTLFKFVLLLWQICIFFSGGIFVGSM